MLRVPSKPARNLLDLADLIENVDPDLFNMRHWTSCVCGHYMRSHGREDVGNFQKAAEMLGVTEGVARAVFCCDTPTISFEMLHTPKEAAERIRKIAFALVD